MKQMKHAMKPLTGLAVLLSLLAPAESQVEKETIVWKLAQTWGTGFPIFGDAVIKMADMVKEMSGGELEIRIDSSNKHKAAFGILDMVNAGQYQMGHSASYYWKGKEPSAMFFTTMPFGMIAPEQYAWFYYGGGMELMQRVYDKHGVYSFPGGNTGNQMGGWFRKEINTLDDLQGLERSCPSWVSSSRTLLRASFIRHSIAAPSMPWSGSGRPSISTWVSRRLRLTTTPAGTSLRQNCSSW
jgi:TRAP-type mannitol/chloroaromatic compound transport system substrate-binding protein